MKAQDVMVEIGTDRRVAQVRHFPLEDRVRRRPTECRIVELRPGPGLLDGATAGARAMRVENEQGWLIISYAW
jgi:hypothetical protein